MDTENLANQAEGDDTSQADTETPDTGAEDVQTDENEQLFDEDGNPIEEPDEDEEVDLDDDLKIKVPKTAAQKLKELKEGNLRQADYTKKTTELAEARKSFEAERQAATQADENELEARGTLRALNTQITQYENIDWNTWQQQAEAADAENFTSAEMNKLNAEWRKFQQFKDARDKAHAYLGHISQQRRSNEQQAEAKARDDFAKLTEEGTPAIKKAIPDWSGATAAKLFQDSMSTYSLTREEISGAGEREILILNDAAKWRQHQAKTKTAQAAQAQTELKPAAKIGGAAPKTGLDDRLSTEEWVRRRNAKVRQRA